MNTSYNVQKRRSSIVFLTRSLEIGGAERQLVILAAGLHRCKIPVSVLTFYNGGQLRADLEEAGVPVVSLGKRSRWDIVRFLFRLLRYIRNNQLTVLHGYLPLPNVLAVVLKPLAPGLRVVWGIRASYLDLACYDWLSRLTARLENVLSAKADLIIVNAHAGGRHAVVRGFPQDKITVVPNGIDTTQFRFDCGERHKVRHEFGLTEAETLVGFVARLDPIKDHPTFLHAAAMLAKQRQDVRYVCVGDGPARYRESLVTLAEQLGLKNRILWVGERQDLPIVYSAFDIAVSSSSSGEGFSNAIAEAMACKCPCAVTDVGDSALIIGDLGEKAPPGDPEALAAAMSRLLDRLSIDGTLRNRARKRVIKNYSVESLVSNTLSALARLDD